MISGTVTQSLRLSRLATLASSSLLFFFFFVRVKSSTIMLLHPYLLQDASLKPMAISHIITLLLSDLTKLAVTPSYHLTPSS